MHPHARMPRAPPLAIACLVLMVALAGCTRDPMPVAPITETDAATPAPAVIPEPIIVPDPTWPTGCSAKTPQFLHGPGQANGPVWPWRGTAACFHATGYETIEPTIGILSDGTVVIGPGLLDWPDQLPMGEVTESAILRSTDQGQTWTRIVPNIAGVATHPSTADPYLYVDPTTDRIWMEDLTQAVVVAVNSWSDDGGDTWQHGYSGGFQTDHPTVFAGPAVSSPTHGYPNVVYRCAMALVVTIQASSASVCQRSLTGGSTWLPPGEPAYTHLPGSVGWPAGGCTGGQGHGFVAPSGRVYLPRGHCGQPFLAWSDDEGMTWTRLQVSPLGVACDPIVSLRMEAPACADGPAVGMDAAGTLHYAWVAADRLAYVTSSQDGGATWDEPVRLSPPNMTEVSHLKMAASGGGRIAWVFYGSWNSPGAPWTGDYEDTTWNAFMGVGSGVGTDRAVFQTWQVNPVDDILVRGPCEPLRCPGIHDFLDIRIAPDGTPWAPLADACVAACETRQAGWTHDNKAFAGHLLGVDLR